MNVKTGTRRITAIALTVAAACAAAMPAQAQEKAASKQETTGVVSGLTIGALAGGPFGAIIGAAAGAWLGDRYHRQDVTNTSLESDLTVSNMDRARLRSSLVDSQSEAEKLAQLLEQRSELEAQVIFRTGDSALPAGAFEQLQMLGALANTMPDMRVVVSGFADPRGTEDENSSLSQERADAVAAVLASAGIDSSRLSVEAHGESESTSQEGDMDGYAFDRRVVVKIEQKPKEAVARSE
jgi:outer membrane protein OmpA-like peptidoglycan-associated protein